MVRACGRPRRRAGRRLSRPRRRLVAAAAGTAATLTLAGCSFQDPPTSAAPVPVSAAPESQDPCTQLALALLDGQLDVLPTADPASTVQANQVVAEFVQRYDAVLVASGVPAARAALSGEVATRCQQLASEPAAGQPPGQATPAPG